MTDETLSFHDEPATAGPVTCARCARPISEYWSVDGLVYCGDCKEGVLAERTSSAGAAGRVAKAFGIGLGGMLVGSIVWYTVAKLTGWEIGFIAILLGWLVGKGVFIGSGKRGGAGYQVMAIGLTYLGIGLAGLPFAMDAFSDSAAQYADSALAVPADTLPATGVLSDSQVDAELHALDSTLAAGHAMEDEAAGGVRTLAIGIGALILIALSLPVLSIVSGGSLIGVLIYGFALYEAWKFTRRVDPVVSGPHQVGSAG